MDTLYDPVCKMEVEREDSAGIEIHAGHEYGFCNPRCHKAFVANPERFAVSSEVEVVRGLAAASVK